MHPGYDIKGHVCSCRTTKLVLFLNTRVPGQTASAAVSVALQASSLTTWVPWESQTRWMPGMVIALGTRTRKEGGTHDTAYKHSTGQPLGSARGTADKHGRNTPPSPPPSPHPPPPIFEPTSGQHNGTAKVTLQPTLQPTLPQLSHPFSHPALSCNEGYPVLL